MKRPLVFLAAVVVVAAGALAWAQQSGQPIERLTAAARQCGFENPRFPPRNGAYELKEDDVSGDPNPPLTEQQRRHWDRIRLVRTNLMPCLQQAARGIGVRV